MMESGGKLFKSVINALAHTHCEKCAFYYHPAARLHPDVVQVTSEATESAAYFENLSFTYKQARTLYASRVPLYKRVFC